MSREFLITMIPAIIMAGFAAFGLMTIMPDAGSVVSSGH